MANFWSTPLPTKIVENFAGFNGGEIFFVRPPSALLRALGLHLRSAALPSAAGTEDRRA